MLHTLLPHTAYIYFSNTLSAVSVLALLATILPLIRSDYWFFRALEYPRFQKFIFSASLAILWVLCWPFSGKTEHVIGLTLLAGAIYQLYKIWPYTFFGKKEMLRIKTKDELNRISLLCCNVLQTNRQYERTIAQINRCKPDVILLLETDTGWENAMQVLEKDYPYTLKKPLPNTYGLLFYSKLKTVDAHVRFLVDDEIPSIDTKVILPSGQPVQLWGLHPRPPAPKESITTTAKDKELMKIALKAKDCELPVIVMGDLNDVAWSYTTELFRKTSGLLDPRRGRGFYSTFSAESRLLRFPLDYIFCSKHFGLVNMKRLSYNGSDHFPMFIHLQDCDVTESQQVAPGADQEELQKAVEMARQKVED